MKLFERLYPERLFRALRQQVLYGVSSADQVGSGVERRNQTMENRGLRATAETRKASSAGRLKSLRKEPWEKLLTELATTEYAERAESAAEQRHAGRLGN